MGIEEDFNRYLRDVCTIAKGRVYPVSLTRQPLYKYPCVIYRLVGTELLGAHLGGPGSCRRYKFEIVFVSTQDEEASAMMDELDVLVNENHPEYQVQPLIGDTQVQWVMLENAFMGQDTSGNVHNEILYTRHVILNLTV